MRRTILTLMAAAILAACGDGPKGPNTQTPVPTTVAVSPTSVDLLTGDTLRFTATVRDQNGAIMSTVVQWSVDNTALATVTTAGLLTAHAAGTLAVSAKAGAVTGTASALVQTRPLVDIVLDPREVVLTSIGANHQVAATANGAAVTGLVMELVSETRWVDETAVVAVVGAGVVAEGAGHARLLVSGAGTTSDTLTVRVEPQTPTVTAVSAPDRAAGAADTIRLRGYLTGVLPAHVTVDGGVAEVVRSDSATLVLRARVAPLSQCGLPALATVTVAGALARVPLQYLREREGEIALGVGEDRTLNVAEIHCLRTAPVEGAEFLLGFVDTRFTQMAKTQATPYRPDGTFQVSARDLVGVGGAAQIASAIRPYAATASDVQAASDPYVNSPHRRQTPWAMDEVFTMTPIYGPDQQMQVVAIYDDYFVVAVPVAEVEFWRATIRPGMDAAMAQMLSEGIGLLEQWLIAGRTTTGASGQELLAAFRSGSNSTGSGGLASGHTEYSYGDAIAIEGWLNVIAHELAHRWHFKLLAAEGLRLGQGPYVAQWAVEGLATFAQHEIVRRWAGHPFLDNIELNFFAHDGRTWMNHSHAQGSDFRFGYQPVANYLRDLTQRLRTDAGLSHDDAVSTVLRGAAFDWYGCDNQGRCATSGLADVMGQAPGANWDPAESMLTWILSQAADERTDNPMYQNLTWNLTPQRTSPGLRSIGRVGAGSGAIASEAVDDYGTWHFLLADDAGVGGAFRADMSVAGGRWRLLRVQ